MAITSVLELDVSGAGAPGSYRVEVIRSPAGEASATFELEPLEFIERLDELQQTLLASSVPSRRLLGRGETSVRNVGQRLFNALFSQPAVAGVYRASRAVAMERGEALRIVLRISAPELAALPWESMFDPSIESYLSRREPLVRYVPVPLSPLPLKVRLPLRVLALIASPRGLAPLDVEKERENLTQALRPLITRGAVVVQWLEHATWPALQDMLLADSWHVVHFIGHGDFDIERDEGVLALETEQGRLHRVPAEDFVDLLREAQPMPRLVVLNACESSTSGQTDLFSGAAAALVRGGVSAVTAMQFVISDRAAIAFSRGFYTAIGRGRSIDEAVRSGRVAIVGLGADSLEWITPTLFLRGQETHLFALSESLGQSVPEPILAEQRSRADDAVELLDTATAVPLYDSVLAENPDDEAARQGREWAVAAARDTPPEPVAAEEEAQRAAEEKRKRAAEEKARQAAEEKRKRAAELLAGRYELGELLARGGMAEVRRAVDTRLGRPVAIKQLRTDLATDPTFQARFRREAQSAAGLNHPNIVGLYDTGEETDPQTGVSIPYIVMELVEGPTLRDVLRDGRKILPERALELTQGVLDALSYSHLAGIIHRDIKPANVMLTQSGTVKVMDFGIARAVADTSASMTQTAAVIGTAQYLSPEQARGETVDARSDIYSAGCLMYELLVGRPPFIGESPVSVAYQHVREAPVPPSQLDPVITPDIDAVTLKALAKDPADRYQSAREMKADLSRVLAGQTP